MAARNVKTEPFDRMDKLPSATLKRNPKNVDLNKNDLLRLLSYLEGELQARDISIAALKAEKAKQLLYQAKYGRFGLGDPFLALQRDSDSQKDNSFDEAAVKAMYDNQLMQLENLIETQQKAQHRMREQLAAVEKRYHKVVADLEEEKRKHAQDTEQGDNVTYMLEKERERLKQEVDFEKTQVKKLEKELKKANAAAAAISSPEEEGSEAGNKHKTMAIQLLKERTKFVDRIVQLQQRNQQLENTLKQEQDKTKNMAEGLANESQKSLQIEAEMEKHMADCDTEKEQLKLRLNREESRNKELTSEVEKLKVQVDQLHRQLGLERPRSMSSDGPQTIEIKSSQRHGISDNKLTSPVVGTNNAFKNTPPHTPPEVRKLHEHKTSNSVNSKPLERTVDRSHHERPIPAEKPPDLNAKVAGVLSAGGGSGANFSPASHQPPPSSSGPTVFTTPSGTRISVAVGGSGGAGTRKQGMPLGRGTPPPIPPNKPQPDASGPSPNPPTPTLQTTQADSVAAASSTPNSNLEIFGQEMADLQQLLVSMVAGTSESDTSSVEDEPSSTSPKSPSSTYHHLRPPTLSLPLPPDAQLYPLHTYAASGDPSKLQECLQSHRNADVNQPMKDGTTPVHSAAENGQLECLDLLLKNGGNVNALRDDNFSPLHSAAGEGQQSCLSALLAHGGFVNQADASGWTPLHWAAYNGHAACCDLLIERGARLDAVTEACWTPLHASVQLGHADCLEVLLRHRTVAPDVINMADQEGCTVAHLSAARENKDCLEMLVRHCAELMDLHKKDKWHRTVFDVASKQCADFLQGLVDETEKQCLVGIALQDSSFVTIGNVTVSEEDGWTDVEEKLAKSFQNHLQQVAKGLRTKKTVLKTESVDPSDEQLSLGISHDSIKEYSIGNHSWSPGTSNDQTPFDVLSDNEGNHIGIHLFDLADSCQDSLAYECLIPLPMLKNYLRLVSQHRTLLLHGPLGVGKSFLARKLAQCVQAAEAAERSSVAEVHIITLSESMDAATLMDTLLDKGCLVPAHKPAPASTAPIVLLDDLGKTDISAVLTVLLPAVRARGPQHTVRVGTGASAQLYYLHPSCYLLGTVDSAVLPQVSAAVQQGFCWAALHVAQEPVKTLLHRHLYRRLVHKYRGSLPPVDDMMFRTLEWVISVWLHLNESLVKLSLQKVVFGPAIFLSCPVDTNKPKAVLRWLTLLWNHKIAPAVLSMMAQSSPNKTGTTQKVANTALYVLVQRAVVKDCPLPKPEKDRYMSGFHASNELNINMKDKKSRSRQDTPSTSGKKPRPPLKQDQPWSSSEKTRKPSPPQRDRNTVLTSTANNAMSKQSTFSSSPLTTSHVSSTPPPSKATAVPLNNGAVPDDSVSISMPTTPTTPGAGKRGSLESPLQQAKPAPATSYQRPLSAPISPRLMQNQSYNSPPPPYPGAVSNLKSPMSPGGSALSPNAQMLFGNNAFAVSGIPASPDSLSSSRIQTAPALGVSQNMSSFGAGRVASPAPARLATGNNLPPRIDPLSSVTYQKTSSYQTNSLQYNAMRSPTTAQVPTSPRRPTDFSSNLRRALSPGPELYRNDKDTSAESLARRAFSPGPEIIPGGIQQRQQQSAANRHSQPPPQQRSSNYSANLR